MPQSCKSTSSVGALNTHARVTSWKTRGAPTRLLRNLLTSAISTGSRCFLTARSPGAFKLTVAALLVVAALGTTHSGSEGNFADYELGLVLVRRIAVSGVLLAAALLIPWPRTVANAVLAAITLACVFTAYIVHTELFYPQNRIWLAPICAAAALTLFVAFQLMDERRWAGLALSVVAALPVATLVWKNAWPALTAAFSNPGGLLHPDNVVMWATIFGLVALSGSTLAVYAMSRIVEPSRWGVFALFGVALFLAAAVVSLNPRYTETVSSSGYYADGWEDHPGLRSVSFHETPNIYFIGFDAIAPEAITRKHMGIATTEFHRIVERDMRRFRNLFANSIPTRHSLSTLLALDLDFLLAQQEKARSGAVSYLTGHDLSPLVWLLGENGYESTFMYPDTYFGRAKGPHIDNYVHNDAPALCTLLDEDERRWAFWGHCWNHNAHEVGPLPAIVERLSPGEFLVRALTDVDRSRPQFVIAHFPMPGHTQGSYDHNDANRRSRFLSKYEANFNEAAIYLQRIVEHLRANDPGAILFVYGDHGAYLSRAIEVDDDPEFYLQDRFAILGGVYPPDRCSAELDRAERKGYLTTLDVVHAILECLSGGESALVGPRNDRFWSPKLDHDHSYRYENFLYE